MELEEEFVQLKCEGFRNLSDQNFRFIQGFNLISGPNGSGKTSVLETLYFLVYGKSFRSNNSQNIIRKNSDFSRVVGDIHDGYRRVRVGVERSRSTLTMRVDGRECQTRIELALKVPLQVLSTETQRILQDGPDGRRKLLNWGCFHNDQGFSRTWNRYERALRQRNVALRSKDLRLAFAWEKELAETGALLEVQRSEYLESYLPIARRYLAEWLGDVDVTIHYRRGWDDDNSLGESLKALRKRDKELGFTSRGPHRADLSVQALGLQAQHALSRGQQKLVAIALVLSQLRHLAEQLERRPVVLLDDLLAELDDGAVAAVLEDLRQSAATVLFTAINPERLPAWVLQGVRTHYQLKDGVAREVVSCT